MTDDDTAMSAPAPADAAPTWAEPLQRAFSVDSSGRVVSGTGTKGVVAYVVFLGLAVASMVVQFYVDNRWAAIVGMCFGLAFLAIALVFNKGATTGEIDFVKRRFLIPSNAMTPGGIPLFPIAFAELKEISVEERGRRRVYILWGRDREILMELTQRDDSVPTDEVKAALADALELTPKAS